MPSSVSILIVPDVYHVANSHAVPNATLTTSFLLFSIEMNSPAYRVVTCMCIILLVVFFFINLWFTVLRIWQGKLLIVRDDWRVKQKLEGSQKEK